MDPIKIGNRVVGDSQPVFIIAEIGYNFNTMAEAEASIDAAVECGVDAVKFQTFKAETVTSRHATFPAAAGTGNQFEEFKRYELSAETHERLFAYSRKRGMLVFSTPSHADDVALLERLDVPAYKIGSDDLTNLLFLKYVAERKRPVIFSTGMGTLAEVDEAVRTLRGAGNDQLIMLHCVSNYPIRDLRVVNLNVIRTLRQVFNMPVGFSDHTTTLSTALGAVALGACVVERHFTLDKKIEAPDAPFSADPAEMAALVRAIRELEQALGDGVKTSTPTEQAMRLETRKSVIARRDIPAGQAITADMIIIKRPGTGVPPKLLPLLLGRRPKQPIRADDVITWEKLE